MASANYRLYQKVLGSFLKVRHIRLTTSRTLSSTTTCCQHNLLYGAVCLQRLPVITPPKSKTENRFSELLAQIELENSHLSDFEVQLIKESQAAKKAVESEDADETPLEVETVTCLDMQDKWDAEIKEFVPAPRETEADGTNDQHSLDRKLDTSLYLLVKQNIEGNDHWVLPQALWEQGETLRQTAERALSTLCGEVRASFLGNAPCAVAKFEPKVQGDKKVKAWYKAGEVTPNKLEAKDYLWVTREEFSNYCHASYRKHLKKFIFDL